MDTYRFYLPQQDENGYYSLLDVNGEDVYDDFKDDLYASIMRKACNNNQALRYDTEKDRYRRVDNALYYERSQSVPNNEVKQPLEKDSEEHDDIVGFIQKEAISLKPDKLIMDDLKWKYMVRNIVRAQNTLMTGPSGCCKTKSAEWCAEALDRPLFKFNLGATQDPRGTLIGNTHFDSEDGTFFNQSPFIEAIQTPNAVILLDELSRANPEAFNILMSVLDDGQRYLRIDEDEDSPIIEVHPTVTFMATANVGHEYSATRVIDRAIKDRFVPIRLELLDKDGEMKLLTKLFPNISRHQRNMVAEVVTRVRDDVKKPEGQLEFALSTRHSIEMASMLNDGFNIHEVLAMVVWPQYDKDGGTDSDLTYVKQLVQAVIEEEPEEMKNVDNNGEFPDF